MTPSDRRLFDKIMDYERRGIIEPGHAFNMLVDPSGWSRPQHTMPRHMRRKNRG